MIYLHYAPQPGASALLGRAFAGVGQHSNSTQTAMNQAH